MGSDGGDLIGALRQRLTAQKRVHNPCTTYAQPMHGGFALRGWLTRRTAKRRTGPSAF